MKIAIRSGGQTGVDRAALDAALDLGLPCGGWCPKGRKAEDGVIPTRYPLQETPSADYRQRTEWNVRDSDGTLVLCNGVPNGGTALAVRLARKHKKPCLVFDLSQETDTTIVSTWIQEKGIEVLNVAGSRERKQPGVQQQASELLRAALSPLMAKG